MMPAYKHNRLYAAYFIIFTFIGKWDISNFLENTIRSQLWNFYSVSQDYTVSWIFY
jgi:hypothetical protein